MRMKIKNRILASVLSFLIIIATAFSGVMTAKAAEGDTTSGLQVGHYYFVRLNVENDTTDMGIQKDFGDDQINTIQMYSLAKDAIVYRSVDGNYEVTIRIDDWDLSSNEIAYQISKEGAIDKSVPTYKIPFGDYNLKDKVFYDKLCSNGAKTVGEEYNEKYFQENELKIETDSQSSVTKYVTFPMNDIDGSFYVNKIYNKDAYNSTIRVSLKCSGAKEISSELSDYTEGYKVNTAVSGNYSYYNSATDCDKVEKILSGSKTKKSTDGLSQSIEIDLNQKAKSILIDTAQSYSGRNYDKNWTTQDTTSEINLSYYSFKEAVFGKSVKLTTDEGKSYWIRIGLRAESAEDVVKNSNGIIFKSSTDVVDSDADFNAYELKPEMDYYDKVKTQMGASVSEFKAYRMSLIQNGESYQPYKRVNLEFDLPQGWNADTTAVYVVVPDINGYDELTEKNANRGAGEFVIKDNKVILSTTLVNEVSTYANYTGPIVWVLANTAQPFDVNALSDGVYNVGIEMVNETDITSLSMSNAAIKNHEGTLYVYNNGADKDLYLDMDSVSIGTMKGYLYRMYTYPKKDSTAADRKEVNYISYKVDENKKPINDDINREDKISETILYPQKLVMKIPMTYDVEQDGTTISNVFKVNCNVPIMDIVGGAVAGSGDYARDAYVRMLNATKIENEEIHELTPSLASVDKTKLKNVLDMANECITNPKENYNKDNLDVLIEKVAIAQEVYEYVNSTQKEVDKQTQILENNVSSLEGYKAGIYTIDVSPTFANSSENVKITGVVGATRVVVAEDLSATAYMDIIKETTSMPAFDYSEDSWITGLLYKDSDGKYQTAKVEGKDEDGNIAKVSFPIKSMTDNVELAFTLPDDTEQYLISVAVSNIEKQSADKTELKKVIVEANTKIAQKSYFTEDTVKKLETYVEEAEKIQEYAAAIQSEIDEQTEKVKEAINNLKSIFLAQESGIYTMDVSPSFANSSENVKITGVVGESRAVVSDDFSAKVYMNIEKETTSMPTFDYSEDSWITSLLYKDSNGEYQTANVEEKDENGNITKVSFLVNGLTDNLDLAFTLPDDTEQYKLVVAISNVKKQLVDKTKLKAKISEAEDKVKGDYTQESKDELQKAISKATLVYENPVAIQNEVDEQIETINAQIGMLVENLSDGVYNITGRMWQAKMDSLSMGDAAITKPMKLVVTTDKDTGKKTATLKMTLVPLTTSGFTGYLYQLNYFPKWYSTELPKNETPVKVNIESYYDGIYDAYNDPTTALDKNVQGKIYPHVVSMPVNMGDNEIWVQVYVPVMECIGIQAGQTGSGWQYAKLKLDWTSLKSADDTTQDVIDMADGLYTVTGELRETDSDAVSAWNSYVDKVRLIAKDGKTTAYIDFKANGKKSVTAVSVDGADAVAVKDGRAVVVLPQNVEYTAVKLTDSTGANGDARLYLALRSAAVQKVTKTSLKSYIDKANALKTDGKAYTDSTLKTLNTALAAAKKVYADEAAIQSEVGAAGLSLKNAVNGMKLKTDISPAVVSGLKNMTYTGKTLTQDKNITVTFNKKTLVQGTDYKVSYKNNKARGTATVTITGIGNYTGTKTATFKIIQKVTPEVTLSKTAFAYTGKVVTPAVTVKIGGKAVSKTNYTVSMSSGRKALGTYKVKVTMKGYYSGSKTVTFKIVPKGTSVTKTASYSKAFAVRWGAQKTQTTGYQIQYSTSSKFKSGKTATVSSNKTLTKKVTGLAANKKYYVRVRTYRKVGKTVYYSAWSKAVSVKTK